MSSYTLKNRKHISILFSTRYSFLVFTFSIVFSTRYSLAFKKHQSSTLVEFCFILFMLSFIHIFGTIKVTESSRQTLYFKNNLRDLSQSDYHHSFAVTRQDKEKGRWWF